MKVSPETLARSPAVMLSAAVLVMVGVVAGFSEFMQTDLEHQSRLVNVSARGPMGTAADGVLVGFVISDRPQTVVVRARGWAAGVANAAESRDVLLRVVRNDDGADVGRNTQWRAPGNERLWTDLPQFAPTDPRQAACVLTLEPGAYSALTESPAHTPGFASIEVFVVQR